MSFAPSETFSNMSSPSSETFSSMSFASSETFSNMSSPSSETFSSMSLASWETFSNVSSPSSKTFSSMSLASDYLNQIGLVSVCAKFQLSSGSRSGWKVCGGGWVGCGWWGTRGYYV